MNKLLSVVIPMYNESGICADTAKQLDEYLASQFPDKNYEIVFVNDGSKDGCGDIIAKLADGVRIRAEGYPVNRGKGGAVKEGVLKAEGDYILYTDCDLAYGLPLIGDMYREITSEGSDLVIGSRNLRADGYEGYTALRKFMSKTYIKVISLVAGFRYTDSQCGFKCMKREAGQKIFNEVTTNGFAFDLEVLILADKFGMKVTEFPVRIINHRESESKVNPVRDTVRMLKDVRRMKKIHK
ncbi:MAG: glycosyltransferase [Lachnospiraceae bacterium]|nr:glycosyltransferase [Lachnospiraceae bacterium]